MRTLTRTYDQFIPEFLCTIFASGDQMRVAVLHGAGDMRNELLSRDHAAERLIALQTTPNVYFAAGNFAQTGTYTKNDISRTRAICLDLDYGTVGHRVTPFFTCVDDAYSCLMTMPVTPTAVWFTGHGLQALFLLKEPYVFHEGDPAPRIAAYEAVSRTMATMVQSDATFTPEHLFRVPLTINAKADTEPVQGALLYWNPAQQYVFKDLQAICKHYGAPDEIAPQAASATTTACAYSDLPQEMRDDIETSHSDRSGAMFEIIVKMAKQHFAPPVIHEAITRGSDFCEKYGDRLHPEIDRCLEKIEHRSHVYVDASLPLDVVNIAEEVALNDCPDLTAEMTGMLDQYAAVCGFTLSDQVRQAARFHEHLFANHASGVMETPCGYGKSTWALCHIALQATAATPYLYVVDTVEGLYHAAAVIENLSPALSVGRYHSFDDDRCFKLSGKRHAWKECNPSDPACVCKTCDARTQCASFNRVNELKKPAVIMCHNGFVRLLETESAQPLLQSAHIIIDEDLNAYLSAEFSHDDLLLVESYVASVNLTLKPFLPYTTFAASDMPLDVPPGAITYAQIHYIYRDEQETDALAAHVKELRKAIGTGHLDMMKSTANDLDHVRELLRELLSFFRPSHRGDASYAYRELKDKSGIKYMVKKNRFTLSDPVGAKFWILNASAGLSPHPYPENMPLFGCPDLLPNTKVALHVIAGNPMRTKHDAHVATACKIIREICLGRTHTNVFIATDKDGAIDDVAAAVRDTFGAATSIAHLERGRTRGSNEAGKCTFACRAGLSLFTSIDNVGATAAIMCQRTLPLYPDIFTRMKSPNMPGGRFNLKIMREIYAFSALDELYQTLWRTEVRNGGQVEAIVVIPDAEWLSVLWRTVMPGYRTYAVHKVAEKDFTLDAAMDGFVFLMGVAPGREFEKQDIAGLMGYKGKSGWKDNAERIQSLLEPFFEEGTTNRVLRRKALP